MADVRTDRSLDVLVVGDVLIDAFIKLFDDNAWTFENEKGKWLSIPFGQKVPFDFAKVVNAVGNAANASVSIAKLGLRSGLVSNVGNDGYGRDIIGELGKEGVDCRFVHINPQKVSNYHYVLWYKDDRTILIKHEEYDYFWPSFRSTDIPSWVYLTSIAQNTLDYHDQISEWLDKNADIKLAFQPGTFQIEAGVERLSRIYKRSEVVVMNREEAVTVSGGDYNNIHDLLDKLHALGPKIVVITDGPNGAYASDGPQRLKMPLYPDPKPPYERTGAGDAFASTFIAALAKGNTLDGALQLAPINAMSVVQLIGGKAGLLSEEEIEKLLQQAPGWYQATPF
jgi:ribokinase